MDDIKASAAKHHEDAAHHYEAIAKMHHEAAKQCASGNFEKAERIAVAAAEADTAANRQTIEALDIYRRHAEMIAERKAAAVAEEAARAAKHQAKVAVHK